MRRALILILSLTAVAALPGAASAAVTTPVVKSVSPLKLGIGDTLTIKGRGFIAGKLRNTVVFLRSDGRPVFVKADRATTTKLKLKIPAKLRPFLSTRAGKPIATRFRLRVLSRRFGKSFTARSMSPLIGPTPTGAGGDTNVTPSPSGPEGDCDHDNIVNRLEIDDDNDGLPDTLEQTIKTDPCNPDTDGDGITDGYEYESALDLNSRAVPYPGKRPFPNALDPSDANTDYDGDGLTQIEEYSLWVRYGGQRFPLNYSDGNQRTGGVMAVPLGQTYLDANADGNLSDDEKDADGDGIGNWDEIRGAFAPDNVKNMSYKPGLDYLDPDTDGDGIPDGADDQDHDGVSNVAELQAPPVFSVQGRIVAIASNPLDPCDPSTTSPYCVLHPTS